MLVLTFVLVLLKLTQLNHIPFGLLNDTWFLNTNNEEENEFLHFSLPGYLILSACFSAYTSIAVKSSSAHGAILTRGLCSWTTSGHNSTAIAHVFSPQQGNSNMFKEPFLP